jgi:hypothetical protein
MPRECPHCPEVFELPLDFEKVFAHINTAHPKVASTRSVREDCTMGVGAELKELLDDLYAKEARPLVVVETGCIRSIDPPAEDSDGWSSLYLARWVTEHEGSELHSFELFADNITKAGRILGEKGLRADGAIHFHQGDSAELLPSLDRIDFAYLDTSDDWDHGLAEFQAAEEKGAQIIVMDDRELKCMKAIPYAKENGKWDVQERARLTIMRRK